MACKILFFEYKDSDKPYFDKNPLDNFCIKFFKDELEDTTLSNISDDDFENTVALNISSNSFVTASILHRFKNLRVIALRSDNFRHIDLGACIDKNIAVVNVDPYDPNEEFYNMHVTFKAITAVLCGNKEYRVI